MKQPNRAVERVYRLRTRRSCKKWSIEGRYRVIMGDIITHHGLNTVRELVYMIRDEICKHVASSDQTKEMLDNKNNW